MTVGLFVGTTRTSGGHLLVLFIAGLTASGCWSNLESPGSEDLRTRFALEPLGPTPYPPDNPRVESRIALGQLLFFDPILSGERDVSCGTCHHPDFAFADGRALPVGPGGIGLGPDRRTGISAVSGLPLGETGRNTQTVLNAAMAGDGPGPPSPLAPMFYDGRALGLEEQALLPLKARVEMRGDAFSEEEALDSVLQRLRTIPEYVQDFRRAFPEEAANDPSPGLIDRSTLGRALAAYQRELVTRNSPFDRFVAGDDAALTEPQRRGLVLFFGRAKCSLCHRGPMLSSFLFRVVGYPQAGPGKTVIPGDDTGREEHTGRLEHRYEFRVPSLRNIELTAPYGHAGVFPTLEDVVRFYNAGAQPRHPNVSDADLEVSMRVPIGLTDAEIADIVAFMKSLTDPGVGLDPSLLAIPASVPSGLTPVSAR